MSSSSSQTRSTRGRRTFLRQFALSTIGGVYLGPILSKFADAAEGITRKSPRFVFVIEGNGLPPSQIQPNNVSLVERAKRTGMTSAAIDADQLPTSLKPIAEFADRMMIVQGINGEVCGGGHSTSHGTLGAYNTRDGKVIHDETIDCVLGRHAGTVFENVILGISAEDRDVIFNCSANGPGQSAATFCNPIAARQRLFGAILGGESSKRQATLLDYLQADIRQARSRIHGQDRAKLDAYLEAYESIRTRDLRTREFMSQRISKDSIPEEPFNGRDETPEGRLASHFQLAASTLISGLSDVVTIASGVGFRHFNIHFATLAEQTKHVIGHAVIGGSESAIAEAEAIRAYHFTLIAELMRRLQSIPEENGTMLDNTVIVYLSDAADSHHTRCEEWPFVLLGGAPRLKIDGRCLIYPDRGTAGWRTINTLHNTLLYASGVSREDFGHKIKGVDDGVQTGPLSTLIHA